MTDPSLDRRVAEIVGWRWPIRTIHGRNISSRPSESIADAIAALEAMRAKGWWWKLTAQTVEDAPLLWCELERDGVCAIGEADTLPLAICRTICATTGERK